ncbi:tyrosine-type recombinase/integrase [Streptomyces albidoflavus]|uniref:tyrosine-type recombinase/integrase n=1 Tax=Streptomyces albidoflavus TaxID=1886 RepID=UPI001C447D6A|nr:site-specific integrase [Streptomyces albidoflavus]MBV7651051.1 site-specific integrase [Streptomyces albidoflavus]MBV7712516.1 site-specific integrase [Streptomyces albidoflavus]
MTNGTTTPGAGKNTTPVPEGFSFDVRLWKVTKAQSKTRPHQLRWKVGGKVSSATFATSALAESRRSELWQAMRRGEAFRINDGLPESEVRQAEAEAAAQAKAKLDPTWWEFSREFMERRWRTVAAKTREGFADSLASAALGMMGDRPDAPELPEVRRAVRWSVVPAHVNEEPPPDLEKVCAWLAEKSLPLSALMESSIAEDVHYRLAYRLDGKLAAKDTYKRRRRGFNAAMAYAIQKGYMGENPIAGLERPTTAATGPIDPRVLMNAVQGREFLTAVSYVGSVHRNRGRRLVAFFGCILYAAMRPAEVVGLRLDDCYLPETGWGVLTLRETRPVSGKKWTDSGDRHDKRGLKMRDPQADRPVPIPPVLVAMLRAHVKEFGTAADGRLFQNERGGLVGTSSYWRVWQEARPLAFPPHKVASPLARKPYDGRATCITDWLRSGLPVAEVARRAGTSPEVIDRHYAGCLDNSEEENNKKIEKAMGWGEEDDPAA